MDFNDVRNWVYEISPNITEEMLSGGVAFYNPMLGRYVDSSEWTPQTFNENNRELANVWVSTSPYGTGGEGGDLIAPLSDYWGWTPAAPAPDPEGQYFTEEDLNRWYTQQLETSGLLTPEQVQQQIDEAIADAQLGATGEWDPDSFEWFTNAMEAWATGSADLMGAYRDSYSQYQTSLRDMLTQIPEFEGLDYSSIDRLIASLEVDPYATPEGGGPAPIDDARDQAAKNMGYTDWDAFTTALSSLQGGTVSEADAEDAAAKALGYDSWEAFNTDVEGSAYTAKSETDLQNAAAQRLGYGNWAAFQTAVSGSTYTGMSDAEIQDAAAQRLGYTNWGAYQAAVTQAGTYTQQTETQLQNAAAQRLGYDTWAKYQAAVQAAGDYTYQTDDQLRQQAAQDLGFDTWLELQTAMGGLQSKVSAGADTDAARLEAARNLGFSTWEEAEAEMQRMRGLERGDMQGLTPEERAQYEQMNRQQIASQERRAMDQVEAIMANTGSFTQSMAHADTLNQQIADQRLQYDMAVMNQDIALQMENLARNDRMYADLVANIQSGYAQDIGRQIQQLNMANQQYIALLQTSAQQVARRGEMDIGKAGISEQRYATLLGAGAGAASQLALEDIERQRGAREHQRGLMGLGADAAAQMAAEELQREQMGQQQQLALMGLGADTTGQLSVEDLQRQGIAEQRELGLRGMGADAVYQNMMIQSQDLARKSNEFLNMVANGQAGVQDVLDFRQAQTMAALDGYMGRATLELQEYGAETDGILAQADVIYKGAMTQLGVDQGVMDLMESEYNMRMKPIIDNVAMMMQQQAYGIEEAAAAWEGIAAPFNIIANVVDAIIPY